MTVKITKPEINIREKLTELDYSNVPYEKMPAGSVVQTAYFVQYGGGSLNESETSSSSYQPTTFNVTISPKFSNSLLVITANPNIKSNGNSDYHTFAFYKSVNNGSYEFAHSSVATAAHGLANWRFNGESLWYANAPLLFIDKPNTTESINYKLYHRVSNSSYIVRTGENSADEYMMIQEIKQ
jgi:hypothetical protein